VRPDIEPSYRERPYVKKIDRNSRRRQSSDFDDIYSEDAYRTPRVAPVPPRGAPVRSLPTLVEQPQVRVHLVMPKNFNDAQVIADKFKSDIPVILNLQGCETELSKRLIDFASGLTYALDGGMQRVADKVFLLTPKNVEVSAEERQRMLEKGFFNQF
jgi:cell division inhibitor SepF